MLQNQRREKIIELLRLRKEITVKELCACLYLSPATVRRDLTALEREGVLKRSFGGASLVEVFSDQLPLIIRSKENIQAKKRLCERGAALVEEGDTIFIDASSTTYFLPNYLKGVKDITVVTNNPHLSVLLSELKIRSLCTGGEMLHDSIALVGVDTLRFLDGIYADKCFFSARGYDENEGIISDSSKAERDVKLKMLENSRQRFFLCDSSKLGSRFPYEICHSKAVDGMILEG